MFFRASLSLCSTMGTLTLHCSVPLETCVPSLYSME